MVRLFLTLIFVSLLPFTVASAEGCGPGIPEGMTAAPDSIVVNICSDDLMFVDDEVHNSETIIESIKAAMSKKKNAPVMIFMPANIEAPLKQELLDLVIAGPKGSGFALIKDDGTFIGWNS